MAPARKTHCPQGHPYEGANVRIGAKGEQLCRQCDRDRQKARYEMSKQTSVVLEQASDALDLTGQALKELQAAYANDPHNYALGRRVGEMTVRLVALRQAAKPKPVFVRPSPTVVFTDAEWANSLPDFCPHCHGEGHGHFRFDEPKRTRGYTTRYGNTGSKCLICNGTFNHLGAK